MRTYRKDELITRWLDRAELLENTNPELAMGFELCAAELAATEFKTEAQKQAERYARTEAEARIRASGVEV